MSAAIFSAPVAASGYVGLTTKPSKIFPAKDSIGWTKKTVSNGSRTYCMKVMWSDKLCPKPQFPSTQVLIILGLFLSLQTFNEFFADMESIQQQEVWDSVLPPTTLWWFNCKGDWLHAQEGMDTLPWIWWGQLISTILWGSLFYKKSDYNFLF